MNTGRKTIIIRVSVLFFAAMAFCLATSIAVWYAVTDIWALVVVSVILSMLFAIVIHDNLELRKLKRKLEELSNADPLTGIFNRRYFMQAATAQINRINRSKGESFIILADLDNFKSINDNYGHQFGDMVLRESTSQIATVLRPYDIFARYGGEEFIIFVSDISSECVITLAERVRVAVSEVNLHHKGEKVVVTASFGVAPAAPANELDTAISIADKALYEAKNGGRDRVIFAAEIIS
jgi:diguanylate cyclase (GGDEF)-like protein